VQHGDVVFMEPKGGWVGRAIVEFDRPVVAGMSISHAGLLLGVGADHIVIDLGYPRGPTWKSIEEHRKDRSVAVVYHPAGAAAATWADSGVVKELDYDLDHLVAAAVAALLRGFAYTEPPRFRELWELVHRYSRKVTGFDQSCPCRGKHLVPKSSSAHWFCASFVDHAFRQSKNCLQVREEQHELALDGLRRQLKQLSRLARLREFGVRSLAGWRVDAGDDDGAPPAAPPAIDPAGTPASGSDRGATAVADRTIDPMSRTLVIDQQFIADFEIEFRDELFRWWPEAKDRAGAIEQHVRLIVDFLESLARVGIGLGLPQHDDGERAPRPGEVAWSPLMSMRLLINTVVQASPGTPVERLERTVKRSGSTVSAAGAPGALLHRR
jgi:hypothetical protein